MLLFRAINDFSDCMNIKNGKGILATKEAINNEECLQKAGSHIASASNPKYKDCWISTTKNFKTCACEFSIPQMGQFNTSIFRKPIAVIDRRKIINSNEDYLFSGNFTYIANGKNYIDFGDKNQWPLPIVDGRYRKVKWVGSKNEVRVDKKLVEAQCKYVKSYFQQEESIKTFFLDMTFPSPSDRGNKIAPVNQFSFYDYKNYNIITPCKGMPIVSGLVKDKEEVLVYNSIPNEGITKILTPIEVDVLYTLQYHDFLDLLTRIISGDIQIEQKDKGIIVNKKMIPLTNEEKLLLEGNFLIDSAISVHKQNASADLLNVFHNLKNIKRQIISKILNEINIKLPNEIYIVEDAIFVGQVSNIEKDLRTINVCRYDLLCIVDEGIINYYKEEYYRNKWKKYIKKTIITKDRNGQLVKCNITER